MNPLVSIIIPVYNDPDGLQQTLDSILKQKNQFEDYELIVSDNGSNDSTLEIAREYAEKHPELIQVAEENRIQSSYAARNKGINASKGEIICFIDADMTVPENWLEKVCKYFQEQNADYLGCPVKIYSTKKTVTSIYNMETGFPVKSYLEKHHFVPTCCLSIKREIIEKVGVFDERLESGGDMEFGQRVYEANFRQVFAEEIVMYHPAHGKYSSLVKKGKRTARGIAQLSYYYPDKYKHLYDKYFHLVRYLPISPFAIRRNYKDGCSLNWITTFVLCVFHIPLRIIALISLLKEGRRLNASNRT